MPKRKRMNSGSDDSRQSHRGRRERSVSQGVRSRGQPTSSRQPQHIRGQHRGVRNGGQPQSSRQPQSRSAASFEPHPPSHPPPVTGTQSDKVSEAEYSNERPPVPSASKRTPPMPSTRNQRIYTVPRSSERESNVHMAPTCIWLQRANQDLAWIQRADVQGAGAQRKSEPVGSTQGVRSRGQPQSSRQPQQDQPVIGRRPAGDKARSDVQRSLQPHSPPHPPPGSQPQQMDRSAVAEHTSDSEAPWQETRRRPPVPTSSPMPSTHLSGINVHQEEPDEPMGFPAHNNYNIMVNLAVVSSDLKADDPKVMQSLVRVSEWTPAHLLILIFEDPASAVAESYLDWFMSEQMSNDCMKFASLLGTGMFAFTHKGFVYASSLNASVEQNGYTVSGMVLTSRSDKQEWPVIVCGFPPTGNEIPPAICNYMTSQIDAGAVLVTGLFGNTGPQLRTLFMNKGSGSPIHQGWLMDDTNRVCTYPAYWVLLAYHKPKGAKDTTQDLPHVEALAGIGGSSAELQNIRPFESALLPVLSVPQWTGCVDVPVLGSCHCGARNRNVNAARPLWHR